MKGVVSGDFSTKTQRVEQRDPANAMAAVSGHVSACGPNPVSPDRLSADARLGEVTSLLAAGFLRYWAAAPVGRRREWP